MKQLFRDIIGFSKNLTQVDLLLYFAILVLIILVVSLIYIIKNSDEEEEIKEERNTADLDLKEVVSNIENTSTPNTIEFTSYEKDQEEKAIISYDELIARNKTGNINYDEEEILNDDISVKKIDLDNMVTFTEKAEEKNKTESRLFKYANEEAFLSALQALNELLN